MNIYCIFNEIHAPLIQTFLWHCSCGTIMDCPTLCVCTVLSGYSLILIALCHKYNPLVIHPALSICPSTVLSWGSEYDHIIGGRTHRGFGANAPPSSQYFGMNKLEKWGSSLFYTHFMCNINAQPSQNKFCLSAHAQYYISLQYMFVNYSISFRLKSKSIGIVGFVFPHSYIEWKCVFEFLFPSSLSLLLA